MNLRERIHMSSQDTGITCVRFLTGGRRGQFLNISSYPWYMLRVVRSHVAHVNVEGRNFHSDHELLGEIYADLQGQIDILAELLRSIQEYMPDNLVDMLHESEISLDSVAGDSIELLEQILGDLEVLKGCYEELMEIAEEEGRHLANSISGV